MHAQVEVPFTLTNNSPFQVAYSVELNNVGEANTSAIQPFDCVPSEALVPAGVRARVCVCVACVCCVCVLRVRAACACCVCVRV